MKTSNFIWIWCLGIFFKYPIFLFLLRMMKLIIVLKAMNKIRKSSMTPW